MTDPASSQSQWRSVVGMMGVAGAAVWVAWTLPSPAHPLGSDWGHHFTVAEFLWHPDPDIGYPLFRRPWFGWLLGAVGEWIGYLPAAQLIVIGPCGDGFGSETNPIRVLRIYVIRT